jgi:N-acetyl-anhydromuramyl-L-alanine amidase AmpD
MHFSELKATESSTKASLLAQNRLSPFTYGSADQVTGFFVSSPQSGFFYDTIHEKKRIVLHFTAGHLRGDLNQLSQADYAVSVPFVIARDGTIYQLFSSKYWSHHLGMKSNNPQKIYDRESIGIELSNYGCLTKVEDHLETCYSRIFNKQKNRPNPVDIYCHESDLSAYQEIETPFREASFFASYTAVQLDSLVLLIRWLSTQYSIPRQLLPTEDRYRTNKSARDFRGILSHVNYRDSGKWDIGPAFDWDGLLEGIQTTSSVTRGPGQSGNVSIDEYQFTKDKNQAGEYTGRRIKIRPYDPGNFE